MTIGIIAAEQQEIEIIQTTLKGYATVKAGRTFYTAECGGYTVISVCGGIGKVHAALCTQILISEFRTDCVINTGTAGGLPDSLSVFDMVLAVDAVQHDVDACVFGYEKGQIPGTPSAYWQANAALRTTFIAGFTALQQEKANKEDTIIQNMTFLEGRIASGDTFITNDIYRKQLIKDFHADCVEMEGAAIAQVCTLNAVPFAIVRCISDNAGNPAHLSYEEFSKKASDISAKLVLSILPEIAGKL